LCFAVALPAATLTSCVTANHPNPFAELQEPLPGMGRIVVVCRTRGVGGHVGTNGDATTFRVLHPGGSIRFDMSSGTHTVNVRFDSSVFIQNDLSVSAQLVEGETLWYALDTSGPLEAAKMDSPFGYSSSSLPLEAIVSIGMRLVPITAEKAARIAVF